MQCRKKSFLTTHSTGVLGTLLAIIIPKCPLCIMAYSGAVVMCSGEVLLSQDEVIVRAIFLALCGTIILLGIGKNSRGARTVIACSLAFIGIICVATHYLALFGTIYYWIGSVLLFLAIWLNGSLLFLYRNVSQLFNSIYNKSNLA